MKPSMIFLVVAQAAVTLCSCTSSIKTDPTKLAQVSIKGGSSEPSSTTVKKVNGEYSPEIVTSESSAANVKIEVDMEAEGIISRECLEAWRKALKGDEKGAIAQLDELEKRYPKVSTVQFMKGQVLEHLGKGEEAVKYYRASLDNSEYSSIRQFKLAQAYLKLKKFKEAETIYRKLLKTFTDFPDAKLGLARCLIAQDTHTKEGHQLLAETVILCEALVKTGDPSKVAEGKRVIKEVLELDPATPGAKELLGK
ncbi:MAG TPA: tetratricopeptide repeat protein [Candidatus Obscuribacter sp.]|nr:tetratricopeptide repeat protein [Candidatus Melainabacteria bacterium]HNH75513.1 tetratricopeptide repeat protein [Candidatus Obscuribacter sp.]